jgi:hypothetical protein
MRLPNHPLKVLGSPLMRSAVFAFLREWTVPRSQQPGTPLSPAQLTQFPPTHTTYACLCVSCVRVRVRVARVAPVRAGACVLCVSCACQMNPSTPFSRVGSPRWWPTPSPTP